MKKPRSFEPGFFYVTTNCLLLVVDNCEVTYIGWTSCAPNYVRGTCTNQVTRRCGSARCKVHVKQTKRASDTGSAYKYSRTVVTTHYIKACKGIDCSTKRID